MDKKDPAYAANTMIEAVGNLATMGAMAGTIAVMPLAGAYQGFTLGMSLGPLAALAMGIGGIVAGAGVALLSLMPIAGMGSLAKKAASAVVTPIARGVAHAYHSLIPKKYPPMPSWETLTVSEGQMPTAHPQAIKAASRLFNEEAVKPAVEEKPAVDGQAPATEKRPAP